MNRRVSVWKYVRLKNGRWRYCKPALAKNGKIRPDWVIVKGKAEHHPEGNFYVHRYDNGREIWRKIGESAQEAVDAADFEGIYLHAKSRGIPVKEINTPVLSMDAGVYGWLEEVKLSSRPETYELYEQTIREFQHWNSNGGARRLNVADLSRMDLLKYRMWLIENVKNSPRTAGNKLLRVSQWYRHVMKLKPGEGLVTVKDTRLGVTVREPEIYSEDELEKFFKACSFEESLLFRTYLLTGFREDEVRFLAWGDLDVEAGTLRVTAKPQYDFAIKDHEERRVPVPFWHVNQFERKVDFKRSLRPDWKPQDSELVFPTCSGRPDGHHLEKCKRIARRAGLDESKFWLHKFRSHYATHLLRSGFDIISVRKLLGHKPGSQATFRYLAPMPFDEMREKGFHELFEAFDDYKLRERDAKPEEPEGGCTNEQDATLIADKSMPEGVVPDIMKKLKEELQKAETKHRQKPARTV